MDPQDRPFRRPQPHRSGAERVGRLRCLPSKLGTLSAKVSAPTKKATDPHYGTQGHKDWAAGVFKRAGGRCQHPGCTKAAPEHRMFADHVVERKDGGVDFGEGMLLCGAHHTEKTAAERRKRFS